MAEAGPDVEAEKNLQKWRLKKLIGQLDNARGAGTSMITLQMTPRDQLAKTVNMLNSEYGTASSIKSHVNKLSVQAAITCTLGRLKLYARMPDNGLIIYCGTVQEQDGKEKDKMVTIDVEPFKPVTRSLYMCDSKFHTDELRKMLECDDRFGFIVMDGKGTLFGTVAGSQRDVLYRFTVDLPKKHRKGGQSSNRFARLREESRHNYVHKVAELATQYFITQDRPNVVGLVLAGSAEFKNDLSTSELFDQRLQPIILRVVDVANGGDNGFNQAIQLSADALSGVKLVQEKKLLTMFFDEIAKDSNKYCFGVADTIRALEQASVTTLIVNEELDIRRVTIVHPCGREDVQYMSAHDFQKNLQTISKDPGEQLNNDVSQTSLVDWLVENDNYKKFGCTLEFVTAKSQEGAQFCKGFSGIGGILRYAVDFVDLRLQDQLAAKALLKEQREAAAAAAGGGAAAAAGGALDEDESSEEEKQEWVDDFDDFM